ncbi:unnamed protein product [Mortierella alpina]
MTLGPELRMLRSQHVRTLQLFSVDTVDGSGATSGSGVIPVPVHWRPQTLFSSALPASKEYRKIDSDNPRPQSESHSRVGGHGSSSWSTPPNYKTEFCIKFHESGYCSFEDRCQFVHHPHELQRRSRALTYKTQPCWSGVDCPYQKNHTRCIYLHGDETAEMFDQQRGISFAKVQKIMAKKESKQLRQQQQQQQADDTAPTKAGPATTALLPSKGSIKPDDDGSTSRHNAIDIPSVRHTGTLPWSGLWTRPQDNGTELSFFSFTSVSSFSSASPDLSFSSTSSSIDRPPSRTLKPLTIPPAPFDALLPAASTVVSSSLVSTAATMPELFSPGVMPVFEIPFPSHEQIHEWKDPCFMNEDMAAVSRTPNARDSSPATRIRTTSKLPRAAILSMDTLRTKTTSAVRKGSLFALALKWSAGEDRERCSGKNGGYYELW